VIQGEGIREQGPVRDLTRCGEVSEASDVHRLREGAHEPMGLLIPKAVLK
jgi:hypothetical protein